MEYQWDKYYSIGTNRTNGQVEWTPTQPKANSPHNEIHSTNGTLIVESRSIGVGLCVLDNRNVKLLWLAQ